VTKAPPLLPDEVLRRVLRLSRLDGTGLLAIAGAFALASAWEHDRTGTVAGLLVAGTGAVELHGAGLLHAGHGRGANWLIASQLFLMAAVFGYAAWQLGHVDTASLAALINWLGLTIEDLRQIYKPYHLADGDLLRTAYVGFYRLLALLTAVYQGGMAIHYARRRAGMLAALAAGEGHD
jgi:hypothetical protein